MKNDYKRKGNNFNRWQGLRQKWKTFTRGKAVISTVEKGKGKNEKRLQEERQ
jgi:hypothetical protein